VRLDSFRETDFLREAAWVILCSGFREKTVRRLFDYVSLCFCDWECAATIANRRNICIESAASAFNNRRKLTAIADIADAVERESFTNLRGRVLANPIETLASFPLIGPVTAFHLAKNLGLNVTKPDRHLVRLSARFGFSCASSFCETLAAATGEEANVVDLIVWRYCADHPQHFLVA
jgi:hypothetical protein